MTWVVVRTWCGSNLATELLVEKVCRWGEPLKLILASPNPAPATWLFVQTTLCQGGRQLVYLRL